jgi:hypothetical protein
MACNCFEDAKEKVREATGDPHAMIRGVFTPINGKIRLLPSIEVLYRKKKKDGTFCKSQSSINLPVLPFLWEENYRGRLMKI